MERDRDVPRHAERREDIRRRTSGYVSTEVEVGATTDASEVITFKDDRFVTYRLPRKVLSNESIANYAMADPASQRPSPVTKEGSDDSKTARAPSPREQQLIELGRLHERRDAIQQKVDRKESQLLGSTSSSGSDHTPTKRETLVGRRMSSTDMPIKVKSPPIGYDAQPPDVFRTTHERYAWSPLLHKSRTLETMRETLPRLSATRRASTHGGEAIRRTRATTEECRHHHKNRDDDGDVCSTSASGKEEFDAPVFGSTRLSPASGSARPRRSDGHHDYVSRECSEMTKTRHAQASSSQSEAARRRSDRFSPTTVILATDDRRPKRQVRTKSRRLRDARDASPGGKCNRDDGMRGRYHAAMHTAYGRAELPPRGSQDPGVDNARRRLRYREADMTDSKPTRPGAATRRDAASRRHRRQTRVSSDSCRSDPSIATESEGSVNRHFSDRRGYSNGRSARSAQCDAPTQTTRSDQRRVVRENRSSSGPPSEDAVPSPAAPSLQRRPQLLHQRANLS
jgi:hypothetical protein